MLWCAEKAATSVAVPQPQYILPQGEGEGLVVVFYNTICLRFR